MSGSYDDAVGQLFRAPHASFVTERKRLAGELKAAGDKTGATKLGKLNRPPISAWAVNQLWWQAREAFDKLLVTAARLRDGDLGGTAAHREAIAALRTRAAAILVEAGNSATESTLRRIGTTLSAVAAFGNFDPDPPGALTDDRDPPGFEAAGIPGLAASVPDVEGDAADDAENDDEDTKAIKQAAKVAAKAKADERRRADAEVARENQEAAAERRKADAAKAKKLADRHRHEAALRTAKGDVERRERELERLRKATADAEAALEKAEAIATDLAAKVEELSEDE